MTIREMRNTFVKELSSALEIPIILSDQTAPEPEYPFGYYSVLTPYVEQSPLGHVSYVPEGEDVRITYKEQPEATISVTFCSADRSLAGGYINGDDEVQDLTDRAVTHLRHQGYSKLSALGIVVVQVMDVMNRTTLEVEDVARRYGFDVRLRYTRTDSFPEKTINTITAKE